MEIDCCTSLRIMDSSSLALTLSIRKYVLKPRNIKIHIIRQSPLASIDSGLPITLEFALSHKFTVRELPRNNNSPLTSWMVTKFGPPTYQSKLDQRLGEAIFTNVYTHHTIIKNDLHFSTPDTHGNSMKKLGSFDNNGFTNAPQHSTSKTTY